MPFVARPPNPALAPWVARVWHADLRVPYRSEKILPTPTVELMLNFGDPFDTRSGEGESVRQDRGWVCGVQRRYLHNTPLGRTHMVGVRFRPGCAASTRTAGAASPRSPTPAATTIRRTSTATSAASPG